MESFHDKVERGEADDEHYEEPGEEHDGEDGTCYFQLEIFGTALRVELELLSFGENKDTRGHLETATAVGC